MPETHVHASAADTEPTRLDLSTGSHLDTLYRAAIGPMQADYYLPILSRFETYGRASPSWNWAAFGITLNWMLFRGLWWPAVVYLAALAAAVLALAAGMALADPPLPASVQWSLWAALLTMAEKMGARVIGEGLDTLEELEMLGRLGIHFGQGWLFGRPTPLRAAID